MRRGATISATSGLATFLRRSPDTATVDDMRRFQIAQQEVGLGGAGRCRRAVAGAGGFTTVYGSPWLLDNGRTTGAITPYDFPGKIFPGASGLDHTQAVQAAIDSAIQNYPVALDLSGSWNVSKVVATGGNRLIISGACSLVANSTAAQTWDLHGSGR